MEIFFRNHTVVTIGITYLSIARQELRDVIQVEEQIRPVMTGRRNESARFTRRKHLAR